MLISRAGFGLFWGFSGLDWFRSQAAGPGSGLDRAPDQDRAAARGLDRASGQVGWGWAIACSH